MLQHKIIAVLKENGADIVGFGSFARFADNNIPQRIFPQTRTVIGIAFRVLRGSHRGIEEGSTFYQYTTTGVEVLEENIMPMAMFRACALLEDNGFMALPQRRNQLIMQADNSTNPEMNCNEVYCGCTPELQLDFEQSAVLCGIGELGLHGSLLSDEFGPLQRYCFILTDAEFDESLLVDAHLCDHCGECVKACPGKAITADGSVNRWQCAAYYKGAAMSKNPFMPPDAFADDPERLKIIAGDAELSPERAREIINQSIFYPSCKQGYATSICGKACDMACYIHLEEKGLLTRSFNLPFRIREEWKLPENVV